MQAQACLVEFALVLVLVFCWVEDGTLEVVIWVRVLVLGLVYQKSLEQYCESICSSLLDS